jgi:hypothetical protein
MLLFTDLVLLFVYCVILWFALKGYKAGKISTMIDGDQDVVEDFGTGKEA